MTTKLFNEAPLFLMLAALAGTLLYMRRRNHSNRFALWTLGWLLMALHAAAMLPDIPPGFVHDMMNGVHLAIHGVTGVLFLLSFSLVVDNRRRRAIVFLLTGGPLTVYAFFYACDMRLRWPYALLTL